MRKSVYAVVLLLAMTFSVPCLYAQDHAAHGDSKSADQKPATPQTGGAMGGMMGREGMGMGNKDMGMMGHEGMGMGNKDMGMMGHDNMERMGPRGMEMMMMHHPRMAGIMMQMRGEMMRIRGEAMLKEGDVLKRYGERLQKEGAAKDAPKTGAK